MDGWGLAAVNLGAVVVVLALAYRPLGDAMAHVFTTPKHTRAERLLYRAVGVNPDGQQTWQGYLRAILAFALAGIALLYLLQRTQHLLPYALDLPPMRPDLAFNTAVSFAANTNWQSFSPEQTVGYAVQALGFTVQSFLSAAVSLAVAVALVRGLAARATGTVGNFWVDVVRATGRVLLPMALVAAVVLLAGGVVQNLAGFTDVTTVAGGTQSIPGGLVASQEAIKMLGTNGGGFFNANSAHPFENPAPWTNLVQVILLLVIPFCLPRTLGTMVGDQRAGRVLLWTMTALFLLVFVALTAFELAGAGTAPQLAGAATEGKEQRFGIVGSTLFATATSGTTGGAANSMHGSYTALGGMMLMLNMMMGEVAPGGAGSGIYAILVMVVIAVFLAALLLGRAPVYLGKRLGVRELKLVSLFILVMPALALGGLAISLGIPPVRTEIMAGTGNEGAQGLTEVIYAFVSAAVNNGSAFAGLSADTPWLNTMLGILILLGRFLPIALALALAGSFARQEPATSTTTELPVHKPVFVGLIVGIVLFVALPMFLPYLMVGPLAVGTGAAP